MTPVSNDLGRIFLNGVAVVLPAVLTLALLWWLGTSLEQVLGAAIRLLVPDEYYLPGLGIAVAVALTFAVGLATRLWLARRLIQFGSSLIEQVPIAKTVFAAIRDVMHFVQQAGEPDRMDKVVLVDVADGIRMVGFVTEDAYDLGAVTDGDADHAAGDDTSRVPVYLQMSYQMGGYTVFVHRDRLTPLDMSLEEAMRWVLSAGMSGSADAGADGSGRGTNTD